MFKKLNFLTKILQLIPNATCLCCIKGQMEFKAETLVIGRIYMLIVLKIVLNNPCSSTSMERVK